MTDSSDLLKAYMANTNARVIGGLDANPDEAARTSQMSNDSGVAPEVIATDPENFEKNYRQSLATKIVGGNPLLRAYVNSHPMAASVSNDDWGNLDRWSAGSVMNRAVQAMNAPFQEGAKAGVKATWEELNRPIAQLTPEDIAQQYPALGPKGGLLGRVGGLVATGEVNLASILFGGMGAVYSSIVQGTSEAVRAGAAAAGVAPEAAGRLGREAAALQEYRMTEPVPGHPWVLAGHEPIAGLHPEIDKAKVEANKALVEQLEKEHTEAQGTATWERSPDIFHNLAETMYGKATIGVSGDAVAALYGGKEPEAMDGLLGWVPDIARKMEAAQASGGDIQIPIADWVTRMDPAISKALEPAVRGWPGGITDLEATEPPEYDATAASVLTQMRRAIGTDPTPMQRLSVGAEGVDRPTVEPQLEQIAPEVAGLDAKSKERIDKLIQERYESDVAASQRIAEREQQRRQSKEWKANREELLPQVEAELRQRPDVAADLFIGAGEMVDADGKVQKLRQRIPIGEDFLTDAQKAVLPDHYYSKNGIDPEEVSRLFGFGSSDVLIEHLAAYHAMKEDRSPREMLEHLTGVETDRRMEAAYGNLPGNVLSAAKDQALSENELNLLAEEMYRAALARGQQAIDKAAVKQVIDMVRGRASSSDERP